MKRFILPVELYVWTSIYLLITSLLHWRLQFNLLIPVYIMGGFLGMHLLEMIETLLKLPNSPFRSVLAQILVTVLTFFVLTSSSFPLGKGVVLTLNLRYLYLQLTEFQKNRSLDSWFQGMGAINHKSYLYVLYGLFLVETALFILI